MKSTQTRIDISLQNQELTVVHDGKPVRSFPVSSSRFGIGSEEGSMKTPTGRFRIAEKIGDGMPLGTVFKNRRRVRVTKKLMRDEDLVMTRILWLDGLEPGLNRCGDVDTFERYIYIHGTGDEPSLGRPASHGCIHLSAADLLPLYDLIPIGTLVWIAG